MRKSNEYRKCERIIVKNGKFYYCQNPALFISPKGVFVNRIIALCNRCKKEMKSLYSTHYNKESIFVDITIGTTPAAKEKTS